MKKQFLHEDSNRQDKAKKAEYRERFQDEGDNFDRGGVIQIGKPAYWLKGNTIHFNVMSYLNEDKNKLIETVGRHWKFHFNGRIGTVSQLAKIPQISDEIKQRFEMTKNSIRRALEVKDCVKHPKKNQLFELLEFRCFLEPVEPFPNPVFAKSFAFLVNVAKPKP